MFIVQLTVSQYLSGETVMLMLMGIDDGCGLTAVLLHMLLLDQQLVAGH